MSEIPPEVLFHRYFQTPSWQSRGYLGKADLEAQPPEAKSVLVEIQESYNKGLRDGKNDPDHRDCAPFHFDYIDSFCENAHAFRHEGWSFVGVTIALITSAWKLCEGLVGSQRIVTFLLAQLTADQSRALHAVLLRIMLNFVVSHEYAHLVHRHFDQEPAAPNETIENRARAGLEEQALELDADAFAAMLVLANLIEQYERRNAIRLLQLEAQPTGVQDKVLFSAFVIAVGAYLFVRPPATSVQTGICELTHPPQAMRMNFLMQAADSWCKQKRPALKEWMTSERFEILMMSAAQVAWGMNGGRDWAPQAAFLLSESGTEYSSRLHESLNRHFSRPLGNPASDW